MLDGAYELFEHAEDSLGVKPGGTTRDGLITLEEAECLGGCDMAPCVQVNYRFVGKLDAAGFDSLVEDLRDGARDAEIAPPRRALARGRAQRGASRRAARA